MVLTVLSGLVGLVVVAVAGTGIAAFLNVPEALLFASLAGGVAMAFRSSWTASLRARRRTLLYAITLLVEPILGIAFVVGLVAVRGQLDYLLVAWAFAAAAAVNALIGVLSWRLSPGLAWSREIALSLLMFSLPLIFHAFSMYALGTFDQVIINQLLGPEEMGRYAYAYRWGMAMVALTAAYGAVWSPQFLELVRTPGGRARLDGLAMRGFVGLAGAATVLMLLLPFVAQPLTPDTFQSALKLIPIVTYAYLWYALYTAVIVYAIQVKRTRRIAVASISVLTVTVVANYIVIPPFGITAAAITSVLAYMGLTAAQWWFVRDVATDIRYSRLAAIAIVLAVVPVAEWVLV